MTKFAKRYQNRAGSPLVRKAKGFTKPIMRYRGLNCVHNCSPLKDKEIVSVADAERPRIRVVQQLSEALPSGKRSAADRMESSSHLIFTFAR